MKPYNKKNDYVAEMTSSEDEILKLSNHKLPLIRSKIALNNNSNQDILIKLSKDKSALVRSSVARNKNCLQIYYTN